MDILAPSAAVLLSGNLQGVDHLLPSQTSLSSALRHNRLSECPALNKREVVAWSSLATFAGGWLICLFNVLIPSKWSGARLMTEGSDVGERGRWGRREATGTVEVGRLFQFNAILWLTTTNTSTIVMMIGDCESLPENPYPITESLSHQRISIPSENVSPIRISLSH